MQSCKNINSFRVRIGKSFYISLIIKLFKLAFFKRGLKKHKEELHEHIAAKSRATKSMLHSHFHRRKCSSHSGRQEVTTLG